MDLNLWKSKDELKKYLDNLGIEYRYGCLAENNPETCHLLGDYFSAIDKAHLKAAKVYKANCDDNKFGLSCDFFAKLAYKGTVTGAPDYPLALEYFIKGCDLDNPQACYHGGQMLGIMDEKINKIIPHDPDRSIKMLTKACLSYKMPSSCTLIHSFYLKGFHGKEANLKLAADFALIACDQNQPAGCYNLSRMYHMGDGVEKNPEKAKYYLRRFQEISPSSIKKVELNKVSGSDI